MKDRDRLDRNARAGLTAPLVIALCAAAASTGACRSPEPEVDPAVVPDPIDESLTDAERERNERFEDLRRKRYTGAAVEARAPR